MHQHLSCLVIVLSDLSHLVFSCPVLSSLSRLSCLVRVRVRIRIRVRVRVRIRIRVKVRVRVRVRVTS